MARRLTAHLAGVQERLKTAELARVEAKTRADEAQARATIERSRRRLTVALAAAILGLAMLGGGGWSYLTRQRTARLIATNRVVADALAEAERLCEHAQTAPPGDLAKWSEAKAAIKRARDSVTGGEADDALRSKVITTLARLEHEQAAVQEVAVELERDRKLLGQLETIRAGGPGDSGPKQADAEYAEAFRAFGIDFDQLDPGEAGNRIKRRSDPLELASYLDHWASQRWRAREDKDEGSWRRLIRAAKAADPDPWRNTLRDMIGQDDQQALWRLADDQRSLEAQPARSLLLLGRALGNRHDLQAARRGMIRSTPIYPTPDGINTGDRARALRVLGLAWQMAPGDFWVNTALAAISDRPVDRYRYYSTAVALRPGSCMAHFRLGTQFKDQRDWNEAIAEFRAALRIQDLYAAHVNLGIVLGLAGRWDEAVPEGRALVRLAPKNGLSYLNLGTTLTNADQLEEAIQVYRQGLRLRPDGPMLLAGLGGALHRHCDYTEAIAVLSRARGLVKDDTRLRRQIESELADTERDASLSARLPDILAGKSKPVDAADALAFAQLCYDQKLRGASARLWAETFHAHPKLADDMKAQHRYNAACAAALAGSGQGKDDPPLDGAAITRWRKQAMDWLRADLAAWSKLLVSAALQERQSILDTLAHWKADADLANLRDPAMLVKLPADEQKACSALWAEVDALQAKFENAKK